MSESHCVITGVGLVTPLGVGLDATWTALLAGRHVTSTGIVPIERDRSMSRVAQLGLMAAREAIGDREITDAALIVGTSKGPADEWLADPTTAVGLCTLADEIATALNIAGSPRLTLSAACASGLHAIARAKLLLDAGEASRVIVVASESSLHPLWHGTFNRLGVLAPPGDCCRPFDPDRRGFLISEAAAAVVLERRMPVAREIVITDARIAADATHITGGDPDAKSLKRLIRDLCAADPKSIGFIHAHATATGSDDLELAAIAACFADEPRPIPDRTAIYSHKGSIGHTLGASGMVALALSTRIHATGQSPPMPTTRQVIESQLNIPLTGVTGAPIRSSLVLAAGFGGAMAGLRLTAAD